MDAPFTIAIDTREKLDHAYTFDGLHTQRQKLDAGDYSIVGYEHCVVVERKTTLDMWGCVAGERTRFVRCLERLTAISHPLVVIECSLDEFIRSKPHQLQRVNIASAVGGILSWQCRYRIPFWWAGSRLLGERTTIRHLASYWKHFGGDYGKENQRRRAHHQPGLQL